jgi:TIR domain
MRTPKHKCENECSNSLHLLLLDDLAHKEWVKELATQLRADGVDVRLDHWHVVPGDQLPRFMEQEIRDNDFVLIVCTPKYKEKSDKCLGGVGYEGDIMTAEVFTKQNHRKFIPVLAGTHLLEIFSSALKKRG